MSDWHAKYWDRILTLYGQTLPYFPGKWHFVEAFAHKATAAWNNPRPLLRRGMLFELDPIDLLQRSIYYLGVYEAWETQYLERCVKQGWVVADVGANIGYYTLTFARLVGSEGIVFAFEPAESRYCALKRNAALNKLNNVRASRVALTDHLGESTLVRPPRVNLGNFRLACAGELGQETVSLTTLDHVVRSEHLGRLDLIKIDVEGAEARFLAGARETIHRFRPIIMAELNTDALGNFGSRPEDVVSFLQQYGYRCFRPAWNGLHRLKKLPGPNDYFNVIALN